MREGSEEKQRNKEGFQKKIFLGLDLERCYVVCVCFGLVLCFLCFCSCLGGGWGGRSSLPSPNQPIMFPQREDATYDLPPFLGTYDQPKSFPLCRENGYVDHK